jgi:alkanesulfonate monooxygenase SsuD/methylene tetrahydromethanopterin reductase-like flavin-dependent oxidoreductase (luciferase family)
MQLGTQFPCDQPPETLIDWAARTEDAGFDELWFVEDCFYAGGIASIATALAHTERVCVGIGILPAVARNPAFTAMELATLARLHPGRVHAGLGHGVARWMRQIGALPSSQLAALEETTVAVRRLLAGEEVTMHGRHVDLDSVRLDHPPAAAPRVSLGVRDARSLAVSGRSADGTILAEGSSVAYVRWARQQIAATRPYRITVFASWGPDVDALRPVVASALRKERNDVHIAPLPFVGEIQDWRAAGGADTDVPDAWVHELAIVGDHGERAASLEAEGVGALVLSPVGAVPW